MILEGLVTTVNADGTPHLAPMGPRVAGDFSRFTLRPFPTSNTYHNLVRHPEGVLHVSDDALLLAKAAIGAVDIMPPMVEACAVRGFVLADCCRFYEFVVESIDDTQERIQIQAGTIAWGSKRDFFGFNRAKHAVLEAAILATRLHFLPLEEVATEFKKLRLIVEKTGGPAELAAMELLETKLREAREAP